MRKKIIDCTINFVFGVLIGGTIIVPGLSAGTIMILCGIYGIVIGHVNGLFKSKKNFLDAMIYLAPIAVGGIVGILALSRLIELLITHFSLPTFSLFAGLVLGSVPMIWNMIYRKGELVEPEENSPFPRAETQIEEKSNTGIFKFWHIVPVIIACGLVVMFALLNPTETGVRELNFLTGLMLVISGFVAAASLIFPGLSGALMLVLLGYYETILNAVNNFNFGVLGLVVLGAIIGLLLTAKLVGFLLTRFALITHLAIIGFLIGSVAGIFIHSGTYESATDTTGIILAVLFFGLGFMATLFLSRFQKDKESL